MHPVVQGPRARMAWSVMETEMRNRRWQESRHCSLGTGGAFGHAAQYATIHHGPGQWLHAHINDPLSTNIEECIGLHTIDVRLPDRSGLTLGVSEIMKSSRCLSIQVCGRPLLVAAPRSRFAGVL